MSRRRARPAWTVVGASSWQDGQHARIAAAVARGRVLGECSNLARELANEPGNTLTPREFAGGRTALAADGGVAVEVLDETADRRSSAWACCSAWRAAAASRRA